MAARTAHDEITERTHVLAAADEHARMIAMMVTPVVRRISNSAMDLSAPGELGSKATQSMSRSSNTASTSTTTAGLKNAPPRTAPSFRACWSLSSTAEAWSAPALRP
jgi:hypothetical protein